MIQSGEPSSVVSFGAYEADLRAGELRKHGFKVKIQDLPFRALKLLLHRPNEVVTREEFREALWPSDIFVDFDRGISSAVKRLRDALGDSADNPIFIETIDRRGYRWIAPVSIAPISTAPLSVAPSSTVSPPSVGSQDVALSPIVVFPPTPSPQDGAFPLWKLTYLLPVLGLFFVAWSLRPSAHSTKRGLGQRSSAIKSAIPRHSVNQEAEDYYLRGRYYWNKRTPEDLQKAVDYFTQAIVHDPSYSDAYVGLADCYNLLREYSTMPPSEAYPRALAAAKKAVELDDQSSQAHASLAFASFYGAWDAATADREFRRSIALDPSNATAHHWYASYLMNRGRVPDALAEIERAQALDPTSKSIIADKGALLNAAGRRQEAIALLQQVEKAEPEFISPHRYLKDIYLAIGDYPSYLSEQRKEATLKKDQSALLIEDAAEKGFNKGGRQAMMEAIRSKQLSLYDQGKLSPYTLAETYALEGSKADALKYLKLALDQHDDNIPQIDVDNAFADLRDEPLIRQIHSDLGLPESQLAKKLNSAR